MGIHSMTQDHSLQIQPLSGGFAAFADNMARASAFADYASRKAHNTLLRHANDLAAFAQFLIEAQQNIQLDPNNPATRERLKNEGLRFQTEPDAWQGMTFGVVEGFVRWQLLRGYAINTVNARLSTIKVYCGLAVKGGVLPSEEYAKIRGVRNYSRTDGRRLNQRREQSRVGHKKAESVRLTEEDVDLLKTQPDSPQGRRDSVLMALLLDLGLRANELASLRVGDVNLNTGEIAVYRQKVDMEQVHYLTDDCRQALLAYREHMPAQGAFLLRGSRKDGELTADRMSERAITKRVRFLGELIGVSGLSAHDCRHSWATRAVRAGTDTFALLNAGGWTSTATAERYIEQGRIANEGVKLR